MLTISMTLARGAKLDAVPPLDQMEPKLPRAALAVAALFSFCATVFAALTGERERVTGKGGRGREGRGRGRGRL